MKDPFAVYETIKTRAWRVGVYRLDRFSADGMMPLESLPYSIRVLLENAIRKIDQMGVVTEDAVKIAKWDRLAGQVEIPFSPSRVLLQDFTGVPAVVDLAALRSSVARMGYDPHKINPKIPVDLVIDHSVQVDQAGTPESLAFNMRREFERNRERYEFLRWGMEAFSNFRVVPPAMGIVHQVNLEYLASVVMKVDDDGMLIAYPDSLVGTDSHTTMINGLGVLGWGVGGIEAEHAMIGQPISIILPEVIGVRFTGELKPGVTATDLVLTVTERLREKRVVGKFVEYFGSGLKHLTLADRTTIANMAPEYGATIGFFPVSQAALDYLKLTGRDEDHIDLVERYSKEQGLFWEESSPEPVYTNVVEIDLSQIEASLAGPRRPQDRVSLSQAASSFQTFIESIPADKKAGKAVIAALDDEKVILEDGDVVIAAITSCTNTSNPAVMLAAGLLAKNAVDKGLRIPPYVKTSFAPGSRVVTRYLDEAGLTPYLEALGFYTVGYGCTTCIGNSGPLDFAIEQAIKEHSLLVVSVLSGNRNFEGRVHPLTRANYLASPPLVVAYAIAGKMGVDLLREPLGVDTSGSPVMLADIWPEPAQIEKLMAEVVKPHFFVDEYAHIFTAREAWNDIPVSSGVLYQWDIESTYIQEPPFFTGITVNMPEMKPLVNARVLAYLGDSVTTDHISPAGSIPYNSPAADYLRSHGVETADFNSYGSRRGNHEVMMRGTLGNIRLRNKLVPDIEGGVTAYFPPDAAGASILSVFEAASAYQKDGIPLIILAGKEYGTGSSRDWAAKGVQLLGVRAVIAESFERIHRSNLIGMGVLPLQFLSGDSAESFGLTGVESFSFHKLESELKPRGMLTMEVLRPDATVSVIAVEARIDSQVELKYYQNGGILHAALREMIRDA